MKTTLDTELFREKEYETNALIDSVEKTEQKEVDPRLVWRQRLNIIFKSKGLDLDQNFDFYRSRESSFGQKEDEEDGNYLDLIVFYDKLIEYGLPVPTHISCVEYGVVTPNLEKAIFYWSPDTLRKKETTVVFSHFAFEPHSSDFSISIDGNTSSLETLYDKIDISQDYFVRNETLPVWNDVNDEDTTGVLVFNSPQELGSYGEDILTSFAVFVRHYDLNIKKQYPKRAVKNDGDKVYVQAYRRIRVADRFEGIMFYIGSSDGELNEYAFAIDPLRDCTCAGRSFTIDEEKSNVKHPRELVGKEFVSFSQFECEPVTEEYDESIRVRLTCQDGSYITFKADSYAGSNNYTARCWIKDEKGLEQFVI